MRSRAVYLTVAVFLVAVLASFRTAAPLVPYETASPHQPYKALSEAIFGVSSAGFATLAACGGLDPGKPDCDGTESKPQSSCGECTDYACERTGNPSKLCFPDIAQPPCEGCSASGNHACEKIIQ
jgi:hypothetical protein